MLERERGAVAVSSGALERARLRGSLHSWFSCAFCLFSCKEVEKLCGKCLGAGRSLCPNLSSRSIRPSRCHHEGHPPASRWASMAEEEDARLCACD